MDYHPFPLPSGNQSTLTLYLHFHLMMIINDKLPFHFPQCQEIGSWGKFGFSLCLQCQAIYLKMKPTWSELISLGSNLIEMAHNIKDSFLLWIQRIQIMDDSGVIGLIYLKKTRSPEITDLKSRVRNSLPSTKWSSSNNWSPALGKESSQCE